MEDKEWKHWEQREGDDEKWKGFLLVRVRLKEVMVQLLEYYNTYKIGTLKTDADFSLLNQMSRIKQVVLGICEERWFGEEQKEISVMHSTGKQIWAQ